MLDTRVGEAATPVGELIGWHGERQVVQSGVSLVERLSRVCSVLYQPDQPAVGQRAEHLGAGHSVIGNLLHYPQSEQPGVELGGFFQVAHGQQYVVQSGDAHEISPLTYRLWWVMVRRRQRGRGRPRGRPGR